MKKLLIIICVLLIVFIGMFIYKNNVKQNTVTVSEVEQIGEYISKIYMWQEITEEALPKFDNINNAPDLWIWEVVKKNLENYELKYEEIQEKAIQIFGDDLKKQFPKEGTEYIQYNKDLNRYITTGIGLDTLDDVFFIKNISKSKNKYEVEVVEYLEDYKDAMEVEGENGIYNIYIKNLNEDIIATIKSSEEETKAIEVVKQNIDKFSSKKIILKKISSGNIYIESVK